MTITADFAAGKSHYNEHTLRLALAVQDAAKFHEESYDMPASTAAAMQALHDTGCWGQGVDFSRFYRKELEAACEEAAVRHCMDGSGPLIYLSLQHWWNDSLAWARHILNQVPRA